MAKKFVLIPEEIYQSLITPSKGNTNLDFVKNSLEEVKNENENPTVKNIHYDQALRRYLYLLKDNHEKPSQINSVATTLPNQNIQQHINSIVANERPSRNSSRRRRFIW